jgi:predicted RNA-binding protein Jag
LSKKIEKLVKFQKKYITDNKINTKIYIMNNLEIKELTTNFFEKMLINIESVDVEIEEESIVNIKIKTPDSSLVIGFSGKNLEDIRLILKQILRKNFREISSIHIEVNDYIEQKENKLLDFVSKKIELAKKT